MADRNELEQARHEARLMAELAGTEGWALVMARLAESLADLLVDLEASQPEPETIFLRGQIRALRKVLALPEDVQDRVAELEAFEAHRNPETPHHRRVPEEGA